MTLSKPPPITQKACLPFLEEATVRNIQRHHFRGWSAFVLLAKTKLFVVVAG